MSDQLKDLAANFKQRAATKNAPEPRPTEQGSSSRNLDDAIDLRIENRSAPPTPTTPKATSPKRPAKEKPTTNTGVFTINMPPELEQQTQTAAEQHDLWHIEYIRAAIDAYGTTIDVRPKGPRRRSRTANTDPGRTYKLGPAAKRQLEQAAHRTNRSQTNAFKKILQTALDTNFVPAPPADH